MVRRAALVFLDASVLVAASRSPTGGSATAIEVCQGKLFRAALSNKVLLEARSNITEKFGDDELTRYYQQLAALRPKMVTPTKEQVNWCVPLAGEKDAHVLAAALTCEAAVLLTLDRRHLLTPTLKSAQLAVKLLTPGEFLREVAGLAES